MKMMMSCSARQRSAEEFVIKTEEEGGGERRTRRKKVPSPSLQHALGTIFRLSWMTSSHSLTIHRRLNT